MCAVHITCWPSAFRSGLRALRDLHREVAGRARARRDRDGWVQHLACAPAPSASCRDTGRRVANRLRAATCASPSGAVCERSAIYIGRRRMSTRASRSGWLDPAPCVCTRAVSEWPRHRSGRERCGLRRSLRDERARTSISVGGARRHRRVRAACGHRSEALGPGAPRRRSDVDGVDVLGTVPGGPGDGRREVERMTAAGTRRDAQRVPNRLRAATCASPSGAVCERRAIYIGSSQDEHACSRSGGYGLGSGGSRAWSAARPPRTRGCIGARDVLVDFAIEVGRSQDEHGPRDRSVWYRRGSTRPVRTTRSAARSRSRRGASPRRSRRRRRRPWACRRSRSSTGPARASCRPRA